MSRRKPVKAVWVVYNQNMTPKYFGTSREEAHCIADNHEGVPWEQLYKWGFRCIKYVKVEKKKPNTSRVLADRADAATFTD